MIFTVQEFADYVVGWLTANSVKKNGISVMEAKAAIKNAASQLECDQDGIEAVVKRIRQYNKTTK